MFDVGESDQDVVNLRAEVANTVIDLSIARHPSEPARNRLLMLATGVVLGGAAAIFAFTAGTRALLGVIVALAIMQALLWVGIQIARTRMLAHCALVTAESFPVLDEAIHHIRARLNYHRPVPVFVAAKVPGGISVTNYLGSRIVLIEGDLVKELHDANAYPRLEFLIGSVFGSLKASHARWGPVLYTLSTLKLLVVITPFLAAWMRSVAYTGDRMAFQTSGNLHEALVALNRLLVGDALATNLNMSPIMQQAIHARHRPALRILQAISTRPNLTNRYLELLEFSRHHAPEQFNAVLCELNSSTRERVLGELSGERDYATVRNPKRDRRFKILTSFAGVQAVLSGFGVSAGLLLLAIFNSDSLFAARGQFGLRETIAGIWEDGSLSDHLHSGAQASGLIALPYLLVFASLITLAGGNQVRRRVALTSGISLVLTYVSLVLPWWIVGGPERARYFGLDFGVVGLALVLAALLGTAAANTRSLSATDGRRLQKWLRISTACAFVTLLVGMQVGSLHGSELTMRFVALGIPVLVCLASLLAPSATRREASIVCCAVLTLHSLLFSYSYIQLLFLASAAAMYAGIAGRRTEFGEPVGAQ